MEVVPEFLGYTVLTLKTSPTSPEVLYLFAKEHSIRDRTPEKPAERTLFILGTPPYVTEDDFTRVFSRFGDVLAVYFHPHPMLALPGVNESPFFKDVDRVKGFKVAYVVFALADSVQNVLQSTEPLTLTDGNSCLNVGLAKYAKDYNNKFPDKEDLQKYVDAYMADYDMRIEEEEKRAKADLEPDDEGWVKVTKMGRRPGFSRKESVHNKIMKKESVKAKKKQLQNFYRFQIRESKINNLVKLREKFEEDKKKIELLKQSRKFKPF